MVFLQGIKSIIAPPSLRLMKMQDSFYQPIYNSNIIMTAITRNL